MPLSCSSASDSSKGDRTCSVVSRLVFTDAKKVVRRLTGVARLLTYWSMALMARYDVNFNILINFGLPKWSRSLLISQFKIAKQNSD